MTALPPFSMLLPVYNGDSPEFLVQAFRSSVDDQTLRPDEVILVQDGPVSQGMSTTIRTLVATSTVPVTHIELQQNHGLAHALTVGLEACSHDVVARMDADDISEPERFAVQLELLAKGYELVGSGMVEFSRRENGVEENGRRRRPPLRQEDISKYARFHDPFNHPTIVYRKSAVLRAGGYAPLGLMEDYWLFARMLADGARAINVPEPLVRYRVSSGAYQRRGGIALLMSEWQLQNSFRRSGFTSWFQFLRNVVMRGGYRLVPESVRRIAYRIVVLRRRRATELLP